MSSPSLDSIKDSAEKANSFVEWLAEIWHGKNWVKKLLLLDAIIFVVFNPASFPFILEFFTSTPLPENYKSYFWPVVGLIFLAALIVAIRNKPKKSPAIFDPAERSAIKGLRPFGFDDADIFSQLQRAEMLRECLNAVTDRDFRLGILFGESGCGKTSFLQAGIWPLLPKHSPTHHCVYVKFTDLDPFETLRQALREQTRLPQDDLAEEDFLALLEKTSRAEAKTLVLLFDQFEQFFVHHPRQEQRQAFIDALAGWHKKAAALPVKILFCLRGDFVDRLFELQKAMGYSLAPQDSFQLKKFTPAQATEIFQVIAESADLTFDRSFVEEMTRQELANREDGLISPVDIQILAWVIYGRKNEEKSGFDKSVFQRMGGIEGLLESFLARALAAIVPETRRETALKVMLALIDLENNVRAGMMTPDQIRQKLAGTVAADEIEEHLAWLAHSKVRLVTPSKRNGIVGHELIHERLIPAVRSLSGKALSKVDQANLLLERRMNEWLGNNRDVRFLLTISEWWSIKRQIQFLVWGSRKNQKEEFFKTSQNLLLFIHLGALVVLLLGGFMLSLDLLLKDKQPDWIKIENDRVNAVIAVSFSNNGNFEVASQIVDSISTRDLRDMALAGIVSSAVRMAESKNDPMMLARAHQFGDSISQFQYKADALSSIVVAISKIGVAKQESAFLTQACQIADSISVSNYKARALNAIAGLAAELGQTDKAIAYSARAWQSLDDNFYYDDSPYAMNLIAELMKNFGELAEDTTPFEHAQKTTSAISNPKNKASTLRNIATSLAKIAQAQKDTLLLEQASQIAEAINDSAFEVDALRKIAVSAAVIGKPERALIFLKQVSKNR